MGTRVKKFHPIDKRPSKTRDFYGPLRLFGLLAFFRGT